MTSSQAHEADRWTPRWLRRILIASGVMTLLAVVAAGAAAVGIATVLPRPLPSLDVLETFAPRAGSLIYDANDDVIAESRG